MGAENQEDEVSPITISRTSKPHPMPTVYDRHTSPRSEFLFLVWKDLMGTPLMALSIAWGRDLSEKAMAPHSSTLAWEIPWTEEPGGLQSMWS